MNFFTHIIRRLMMLIPMLIGVTLILFILSRLISVDPVSVILPEKALDNPEAVEAAIKRWGLDKSDPEQYWIYVTNLAKGDLGTSFKTKNPVTSDIITFLPATIELGIASFIFAIFFGLPLGIISALKNGSVIDHFTRVFSLLGASMPPFWSGLVLLFLFYFKFEIFPGPGRIDARMAAPNTVTGFFLVDSLIAGDIPAFWSSLHHLILPAMILGWFTLALVARITRSSMLEVLEMDYIRTARAKGIRERIVIVRHALRNALIPVTTILGLAFAGLMSGAIMTETIFSWPGIGRYAVMSSVNLDYPSIMGVTLVIAVMYIFMNLLVDLTYALIDPRIREG
ncbi:MAG: ABC transporter permease [Anaerolineaceae bacterium]|nr:ABC transporter permease [Anaerolineaceae bacterium]